MAEDGANVVLACRTEQKCATAIEEIEKTTADKNKLLQVQNKPTITLGKMEIMVVDMASQASISSACEDFLNDHDKLDVLVHNAGIMATPYGTVEWKGDGGKVTNVEKQFATNHIGPYYMTGLLKDILEKTPNSRVINHSSSASAFCPVTELTPYITVTESDYVTTDTYGCSKRANRYFTFGLNQHLTNVCCVDDVYLFVFE